VGCLWVSLVKVWTFLETPEQELPQFEDIVAKTVLLVMVVCNQFVSTTGSGSTATTVSIGQSDGATAATSCLITSSIS
jgi:hypothetical protein